MNEWPEARAGQTLTPEMWNAARAANGRNQLIAGKGIRLKPGPLGTVIAVNDNGIASFASPFRVALLGSTSATIAPGFVNLIEPVIDGVHLSGEDAKGTPPPTLKWDKLALDSDGRGFIALEVTLDVNWKVADGAALIVQVAAVDTADGVPAKTKSIAANGVPIFTGRKCRYPLAMIRQRSTGALDCFQIVYGDLTLGVKPADSAATTTTGRAFFY